MLSHHPGPATACCQYSSQRLLLRHAVLYIPLFKIFPLRVKASLTMASCTIRDLPHSPLPHSLPFSHTCFLDVPRTHSAHCCFRAFAHAGPAVWSAFLQTPTWALTFFNKCNIFTEASLTIPFEIISYLSIPDPPYPAFPLAELICLEQCLAQGRPSFDLC